VSVFHFVSPMVRSTWKVTNIDFHDCLTASPADRMFNGAFVRVCMYVSDVLSQI